MAFFIGCCHENVFFPRDRDEAQTLYICLWSVYTWSDWVYYHDSCCALFLHYQCNIFVWIMTSDELDIALLKIEWNFSTRFSSMSVKFQKFELETLKYWLNSKYYTKTLNVYISLVRSCSNNALKSKFLTHGSFRVTTINVSSSLNFCFVIARHGERSSKLWIVTV